MIAAAWRARWEHIIPFLALPEDLRKIVYTTNTIERVHRQIRKAIKTRGHFPDEQAATKLIYLAIERRRDASGARARAWTSAPSPQDPLRRPIPRLTINTSARPHTQKIGQPRAGGRRKSSRSRPALPAATSRCAAPHRARAAAHTAPGSRRSAPGAWRASMSPCRHSAL